MSGPNLSYTSIEAYGVFDGGRRHSVSVGAKLQAATVLYISSDQFSLAAVKVLLEYRGYRVLLARTSPYARQLLTSTHFDVIVLDSDTADDVTVETTTALKKNAGATPILLRASHRYSQVASAACDGFCTKLDGNEALLFGVAKLLNAFPPTIMATKQRPTLDMKQVTGSSEWLMEAS